MMNDYTSKKVNFLHSKISVKINKQIYFNGQSKIYLCSDLNNPSITYCLKIATARNDDKAACNSINTEIIIMLSMKEKPNIVQIIDYYSQESNNMTTYFILMEYCGNGTLADSMTRLSNDKNSFSEPQIWRILYQLTQGLVSIHRNKTAHRDIKPENILITLDGVYKICDFGSSTNKFYENINNHIRNEIIFDISRNTTPAFRAPEQIDLFTGYPINEKVDVWALGLILYSLLFDSQLFNTTTYADNYTAMNTTTSQRIVKGNIVLTDEMLQLYSPLIIELLKLMMKPNPNERISVADILNYMEKNKDNLMKVSEMSQNNLNIIKKRTFSITKMVSDAAAKLFKRHSTQFWIIKLMNGELSSIPKYKYIKLLVNKSWTKKNKINKFFIAISTRPIHFFSFLALKSLYIIHHYIFLGPSETLTPESFNLEEFLQFFSNLWQTRYSTDNYDKAEVLKNAYVTKFIISYADFLKNKIAYHKKYPFIDNNFSIENLSTKKDFDFSLLIDKKFILDTISIYSSLYQKFIQIPIIVNQISNSLDAIIQVLNEELISIFSLIFHLIIAFKNYNSHKIVNNTQISSSNKNDNVSHLKVFDSQFLEITSKAKEYVEKYKKFRTDIKSSKFLMNFPIINCNNSNSNILAEYLISLDNNLKFFPNSEFDLQAFFSTPKEIVGVKLNRNVGRLIQANLFFDDVKKIMRCSQLDESSSLFIHNPTKRNTVVNGNQNKINQSDFSQINEKPQSLPKKFSAIDLNKISLQGNCDFSPEKFVKNVNNFDFDLAYKKEKQMKDANLNTNKKSINNSKSIKKETLQSNRVSLIDLESNNQVNAPRNFERGRSVDRFDKKSREGQNTDSNVIDNMSNGENRVMTRNLSNVKIKSNNNSNMLNPFGNPSGNLDNQQFNQSLFNKNFFSKYNNNNDPYDSVTSAVNIQTVKKDNIAGNNNNNPDATDESLSTINPVRKISDDKNDKISSDTVNSILNDLFESNKGLYGSNINVVNNRQSNPKLINNFNQLGHGQVALVNRTPQGPPQNISCYNNNTNQNVPIKFFPAGTINNPKPTPYILTQDMTQLKRVQENSSNITPKQNNLNKTPSFPPNNVYNPYMINNNSNFFNGPMNVQNMNQNYNNTNDYYEMIISNKNIQYINTGVGSNFILPQGMGHGNLNNPYSNPYIGNNMFNNNNFLNQPHNNLGNQVNNQILPNKQIEGDKNLNRNNQTINNPNLVESIIQNNYNQGKLQNNPNTQSNMTDTNQQNVNNEIINNNEDNNVNNQDNNNNSREEDFNFESVKSDFNSVNIFNIQNNFNNIKYVKEETNIEDLANEFLKEELKRSNLQWLISSKEIKYDKQIGFGGSSEVFKADYRGTEVAVKKLRILEVKAENLKEFKREVSSLILLRHPYLVLFMGAEKDNICIVTEYCAGGTLFNLLHQRKDLIITWELRLRILYEMAVGMNFLHTNSPPIIHRDLKSLNILLTEKIERPTDNTKVKISDFGLSKIMKTFDSSKEQMTGQLGTCHWMAPEVIENKNYSLKADVYSYGIIIWEVCTRKTPYHDMRQEQISFYVTVNKGRPDKNLLAPNTPPAFIKLMEMCWDAEPNNRPSFEQIIDYLKKIKL